MLNHHSLSFRIIFIVIFQFFILKSSAIAEVNEFCYENLTNTPNSSVCLPVQGISPFTFNYNKPDDFNKNNADERINLYASNLFNRKNVASNSVHTNTNAYDTGLDFGSMHKYLGFSTLLLAGIAAVSSSNRSVHYGSAYAATGTALATCWTGYIEYSDRFNLDEGVISEDNLHIIIGVLGTIGFATAVAIADSGEGSSHSGIGGASAASMLISVIVIKW